MGHSDRKKKKRDSSSSSDSSSSDDSNKKSSSDSSGSSNEDTKRKTEKKQKSYSDDEEKRPKSKYEDNKRDSKYEEKSNKMKRGKQDEAQKSKWDSPAENVPKSSDRRGERIKSQNKDLDRNDERDHRRYQEKNKYDKNKRDERYRDNYNDRGRYNQRYHGRNDDRRRDYDDKYKSNRHHSRERSRSRSKDRQQDTKGNYQNRRNQKRNDDNENYDWGKKTNEDKKVPLEKEKPNFGLSGKLAEETNTYRGVVIKYSEPPEARKPKRRWRLYPFKGEKALPTLYIHRESAYLMGRDRKVVDFPLDHPSCSKQHAVLQYRLVPFTRDDGSTGKRVRPYLIDLDSANGTYINNKKIDPRKYVELLEKDVIKFGYSSREYVMLHENSKDEILDDDVKIEDDEILVKEEPQDI